MKKNKILLVLMLVYFTGFGIRSCRKEDTSSDDPTPVRTGSFTEEFQSVYELVQHQYWFANGSWSQGYASSMTKSGVRIGFPAYSYTNSPDEYVGDFPDGGTNAWLLTPPLEVSNGDTISFYTRADTSATAIERLQVRINLSKSTDISSGSAGVGVFNIVLLEINPGQALHNYPTVWTRYQYVFTSLSATKTTRVAFRHFLSNGGVSKGIGIDQFRFSKKQ